MGRGDGGAAVRAREAAVDPGQGRGARGRQRLAERIRNQRASQRINGRPPYLDLDRAVPDQPLGAGTAAPTRMSRASRRTAGLADSGSVRPGGLAILTW